MEDLELERRLRLAVAGAHPAAPASLRDALRRVPAEHRQRALTSVRPALRRSVWLATAAAAVIVALALSGAITSVRNGGPASSGAARPSLSIVDGWAWQRVDLPARSADVFGAVRLANGFMGFRAVPSLGRAELVTSHDGYTGWTSPPDPSIVAIDGDASAWTVPHGMARYGGVLVARILGSEGSSGYPLLWRNADGLHWKPITTPEAIRNASAVFPLPNGFAATTAGSPQQVYVSSNGLDWTLAGTLPLAQGGIGSTFVPTRFGLYVTETGSSAGIDDDNRDGFRTWRTVDGSSWDEVSTPGNVALRQVARVAGGEYVAISLDEPTQVLRSPDGLRWRVDSAAPQGHPVTLLQLGSRVVLDATAGGGSGAHALWQLAAGAAWRPLQLPDGEQAKQEIACYGAQFTDTIDCERDRAALIASDGRTEWILKPAAGATLEPVAAPSQKASPPPTPPIEPSAIPTQNFSPSPTATGEPSALSTTTREPSSPPRTPLPAELRAGWIWQQTDGTNPQGMVEVPGGYVAVCSDPATAEPELVNPRLCSSTDRLHWTDPADPALVTIEGATPFWPLHVSRRDGVYVAFALQKPLPFQGEPDGSIWRSTDGHHWRRVESPAFVGMLLDAGSLPGGFGAILASADGTTARALVSADGEHWSAAAPLPSAPLVFGVTDDRFCIGGNTGGVGGSSWTSPDGTKWTKSVVPSDVVDPVCGRRLADGSFVALGFPTGGQRVVLRSVDGISWQTLPGTPAGQPCAVLIAGHRLVLVISGNLDGQSDYTVWQSADSGATWQPVPGPDGHQLTTIVSVSGDTIWPVLPGATGPRSMGTPNG